ncbi:putative GNAT family acetyltransferase [Peribacillus deserti]|uniref:GNAT family acetyltransferase n=1 Tax=Peribacillus deserti TaxID=673318 RepID=A0ABS2QIU8_9BACI|nr:GNAT family N-acetyltransferase [Peribacillus deserti]MBM7693077.1 putative GNAT family acetyltransferase [Peribacillus deserti]
MIRRLTENDHGQTFSFLKEEPSFNLFIIGDIEAFGYESDFQQIWGEFDKKQNLISIMLRFHDSYLVYAQQEFNAAGYASLLPAEGTIHLSGKSEVMAQFESLEGLNLGEKKQMYFAECRICPAAGTSASKSVQIAGFEDVDRIMQLRSTIKEFAITPSRREILVQAMKSKTGRTYYIEEDGKMTACSSTAAENSFSAMVVGVCTHPEYRNRGYASETLKALLKDLMENENKIVCLFYDNPAAGSIYHRLGFKDIGKWTMFR